MKKFAIGLIVILTISCQTRKVSQYPPVTKPTIVNPDYTSDWEIQLYNWLVRQPEDVRKAFVRDFFFQMKK